jgi:F420H(2)-dependent quinone reductase
VNEAPFLDVRWGHEPPSAVKRPVVATQLTGAERDRIFRKFADYAANYDAYRGRTDRELRVFALTRR